MFAAKSIIEHGVCFEEIERLLHGKCARTIFIHELSCIRKRTSEFSDTKQRVNKNRTKHFPCCNVYFIGTEISLKN